MIDNATAAEALRAIEDAEGRLTPSAVVKAAEDPLHPLHAAFEWDDAKAGHAWRVEQARQLIARVRVEVQHHDLTLRAIAYVRDPEAEVHEQGYRATVFIADDEMLARRAIEAEMARVIGCIERAQEVATVLGVEEHLRELLGKARLTLKIAREKRPRPPAGQDGIGPQAGA